MGFGGRHCMSVGVGSRRASVRDIRVWLLDDSVLRGPGLESWAVSLGEDAELDEAT